MSFETQQVLESNEEQKDIPKKFTNIDKEDFHFEQKIMSDKTIRDSVGNETVQPFSKTYNYDIKAGETTSLPKYLVNFAARQLARKMFKRDSVEAYNKTPKDERSGYPELRNDAKELELMKKMVKKNDIPDKPEKSEDEEPEIIEKDIGKEPEPTTPVGIPVPEEPIEPEGDNLKKKKGK